MAEKSGPGGLSAPSNDEEYARWLTERAGPLSDKRQAQAKKLAQTLHAEGRELSFALIMARLEALDVALAAPLLGACPPLTAGKGRARDQKELAKLALERAATAGLTVFDFLDGAQPGSKAALGLARHAVNFYPEDVRGPAWAQVEAWLLERQADASGSVARPVRL